MKHMIQRIKRLTYLNTVLPGGR